MDHGIVDVFAFQEALLIEAAFGIVLLAMLWAGFRRWLQHKEKVSRLTAEQTAQHGAQLQSVEARLKAIEATMTAGSDQPGAQIEAGTHPLPDPIPKPNGV